MKDNMQKDNMQKDNMQKTPHTQSNRGEEREIKVCAHGKHPQRMVELSKQAQDEWTAYEKDMNARFECWVVVS